MKPSATSFFYLASSNDRPSSTASIVGGLIGRHLVAGYLVAGGLVLALLITAGCSRGTPTRQGTPTLGVGDLAPPIQIDQWMLGGPVTESNASGVQVVEFWATWCGPCLQGMPHLSELQERYADDVTIVGVTTENVATVKKFLEGDSATGQPWKEYIKYRLVTDDRGATFNAYMKASGQRGIPTAFIIGRDGVIEWIGHPGGIDEPLQQVVDGTWNRPTSAS